MRLCILSKRLWILFANKFAHPPGGGKREEIAGLFESPGIFSQTMLRKK